MIEPFQFYIQGIKAIDPISDKKESSVEYLDIVKLPVDEAETNQQAILAIKGKY